MDSLRFLFWLFSVKERLGVVGPPVRIETAANSPGVGQSVGVVPGQGSGKFHQLVNPIARKLTRMMFYHKSEFIQRRGPPQAGRRSQRVLWRDLLESDHSIEMALKGLPWGVMVGMDDDGSRLVDNCEARHQDIAGKLLVLAHNQGLVERKTNPRRSPCCGADIGEKGFRIHGRCFRIPSSKRALPFREAVAQKKLFHGRSTFPGDLPGIYGRVLRITEGLSQMKEPVRISRLGILSHKYDKIPLSGFNAPVSGASMGKRIQAYQTDHGLGVGDIEGAV